MDFVHKTRGVNNVAGVRLIYISESLVVVRSFFFLFPITNIDTTIGE